MSRLTEDYVFLEGKIPRTPSCPVYLWIEEGRYVIRNDSDENKRCCKEWDDTFEYGLCESWFELTLSDDGEYLHGYQESSNFPCSMRRNKDGVSFRLEKSS